MAANHGWDEVKSLSHYTVKYIKVQSGYTGQLVEWPEVVTEGRTLDACRASLRDALSAMIQAYRSLDKEIPLGGSLLEQIPVEIDRVGQAS